MRNVNLMSIVSFVLLSVYCHGEEDIDEIEPDEHAYSLGKHTANIFELLREKRRSRWKYNGYSTAGSRGRSRGRFNIRFRPRMSRPSFSMPSPSFRKPASVNKPSVAKPSVSRPKVNENPDVNKPGVRPAVNEGNEMAHRPNTLQGSNNPGMQGGQGGQGGQAYNPNVYRPPVNQPPQGGYGMSQQPNQFGNNRPQQQNQAGNNRPGMGMPLPIPLLIPLGNPFGHHRSGANQNEHNQSAHNRTHAKGDGSSRYQCTGTTKRLLLAVINLYIFILYYLL